MAAAPARTVTVQVVSDTVWPWCFVGKRRLEDAIASFRHTAEKSANKNVNFKVSWLPFQLNAQAPVKGENKLQMYHKKFGKARCDSFMPHLLSAGKECSVNGEKKPINFSFGGDTGNTYDSHRLIYLAGEESLGGSEARQDAIVEELFKNYFEEEKYIGDAKVLEAAMRKAYGGKVLFSDKEIADFLKDCGKMGADADPLTKPVNRDMVKGRQWGVSGVPYFVVDNKVAVSGAQEADAFLEIFDEVLGEN